MYCESKFDHWSIERLEFGHAPQQHADPHYGELGQFNLQRDTCFLCLGGCYRGRHKFESLCRALQRPQRASYTRLPGTPVGQLRAAQCDDAHQARVVVNGSGCGALHCENDGLAVSPTNAENVLLVLTDFRLSDVVQVEAEPSNGFANLSPLATA